MQNTNTIFLRHSSRLRSNFPGNLSQQLFCDRFCSVKKEIKQNRLSILSMKWFLERTRDSSDTIVDQRRIVSEFSFFSVEDGMIGFHWLLKSPQMPQNNSPSALREYCRGKTRNNVEKYEGRNINNCCNLQRHLCECELARRRVQTAWGGAMVHHAVCFFCFLFGFLAEFFV